MKHRTTTRALAGLAAAGLAMVVTAGTAAAHVGTSVDEVPAGGSLALGLTIGHGCDGSSTTSVAIQIPAGVNDATPFAKAGWTVATERETLDPPATSAHGDPVTERTSVITYTAEPGNALPDGVRDTFTVSFTAPDSPGETLWFKTVQACEAGENAWIEEYDGTGEEPDSPAPSVTVTEGTGEDGHGAAGSDHGDDGSGDEDGHDGDEGSGDEADEVEGDSEEVAGAATSTSDGDGDGTALAVVALVVGLAALATGGAAFAKARAS